MRGELDDALSSDKKARVSLGAETLSDRGTMKRASANDRSGRAPGRLPLCN